ncbi:Piso0_001756 [Millerozyma farinosa CBS 7064]|uniref:Piso0_001756 protein n=1 Tax=Pichia sorbitophila (strain ATCC MYA-4447 / BCRC 22081 / CBS 7064 / NBRC 10061 / NRRL Y-12695) TaxID=559304 RepID=G8YP06_PICSO|nr:Piso0_001756 [Millerozyma farinosa CBS 7064]
MFGGVGNEQAGQPIPPAGYNTGETGLEGTVEDLTLNSNIGGSAVRAKKKRPARAFHGGLGTPQPYSETGSASEATDSSPAPKNALLGSAGWSQPTPEPQNGQSAQESISLAQSRYMDQNEYMSPVSDEDNSYRSFFTFQNIVPPSAGTQFHTVDQGTSSSKFMRATMYNAPETDQLRSATKLPVSVTISPFAPLLPTEDPIPEVDMADLGNTPGADPLEIGPPRCRRCRTYMNPAMQHNSSYRFVCNICQFPNNTIPEDYVSMINPVTGTRTDVNVRPELHRGVYDLLVPKHYNAKGPESKNHGLHHVFLVDISEQSVKQNVPALFADTLRAMLYNQNNDDNDSSNTNSNKFEGKLAIIAYDKRLHFFNLSPSLNKAQIAISSDLDDPFVPFDEGLFVDPQESQLVIEDVLNHLEMLTVDGIITEPESCFAVACRTAMMCLESVGGGKVTSILSGLPSWGPGGLKFKDNATVGRSLTGEQEMKILNADNEYYHSLAKDFIDKFVGLDCLVISPTSVDLSNVGWLCSVTGGSVHKWSNFNFERDGPAFMAKVISSACKVRGYQAQLKLRCSNGLQISQYYGTSSSITHTNILGSANQDPIIPVVNEDQSFTVLLEYDGKLETKYDCHFQAALLYTDNYGRRKVRVINLVIAVSETLENIFSFIEQDAVVTTIARDTLSFVGRQTLSDLRLSINEKLVDVFTQYRAMCEFHHHNYSLNNQLLFPDSLKHFPLYMLALIKTKALRGSTSTSADVRLESIFQMMNMPVERLMYYLYPGLVELHSLDPDDGIIPELQDGNHDGFIKLPKFKDLTSKSLDFGVYILCNGVTIYVWVHPNANELLIQDLFGNINSVEEIDPLLSKLPELPTHISLQARNIVQYFHSNILGTPKGLEYIQIVRPGIDGSEIQFKECLVEDNVSKTFSASNGPAYPEYLTNLHKAIRVKLENDKSSNNIRKAFNSIDNSNDTLAQRLIHF